MSEHSIIREHSIIHCEACHEEWDLDFDPPACTCAYHPRFAAIWTYQVVKRDDVSEEACALGPLEMTPARQALVDLVCEKRREDCPPPLSSGPIP